MKRLITCLFGFALICAGVFGTEFKDGIACGGFCVIEDNYGQGCGEWSFPIVTTDSGFMVRDNLILGGFGSTMGQNKIALGGGTIGNNILIGNIYDADCFRVKAYCFAGVDFSLFGCENHPIFSPSFMLGTLFGGGFEFQYTEKNSFVVEFGGKGRYVVGKDIEAFKDYNSANPMLKLGFRSYY